MIAPEREFQFQVTYEKAISLIPGLSEGDQGRHYSTSLSPQEVEMCIRDSLGSELNLRLLYIHQVAPYFEGKTLTEATSSFLETLLQEYKIPKETKELLRKTISIMVERIHASRVLSCPIPYYRNDLTEPPLVEKLIYHIEMTYKISLSQFAIDFLCFPFNIRFIDTLSKPSYQSEQLANIFQGIVKKVKETILVNFDDEELLDVYKRQVEKYISKIRDTDAEL